MHLEVPDSGDAGRGERLGDVVAAGGGEADGPAGLAGPGEPVGLFEHGSVQADSGPEERTKPDANPALSLIHI